MSQPRLKRPRQAEVAALAGVSAMTVSRALRGEGGTSPENHARVRAAAARLGYVPNRIASGLASARVPLVAVIVPSLSNMVFPEVLTGLTEALEGSGLQIVIGKSGYDPQAEARILHEMLSWRPSAVVLTGLAHAPSVQAALADADLPVVEILDSDGAGIDCIVGINQREAGAGVARAVAALGYRRIGLMVPEGPRDERAAKRIQGFCDALGQGPARLLGRQSYSGAGTLPRGKAMAAALLAAHPGIDLIYCTNDLIAAGALMHCHSAGLAVPGQLGIVGFSGLELLDGLRPRLATVDSHRKATGEAAGRMILARLGGAARGLRLELDCQLDPRETLAPRG